MLIGIDFDNTIVSYDKLFHQLAIEASLISADTPANKTVIRDQLRSAGREEAWTKLQAKAYGSRIAGATPFPGVMEFLDQAFQRQQTLMIISHKTRRPYLGGDEDLPAAAMRWLVDHRIASLNGPVYPEHVFFEESKQAKLARIKTQQCGLFIDDLPEFLLEPEFPSGVQRFLFNPSGVHPPHPGYVSMSGWGELTDRLL